MEEKHRSPPVNPLLLRIRTSIASLRSTSYATNYNNLLPFPTVSPNTLPPRHGRIRMLPSFVRRKWGYISFISLILLIILVRSQFSKRNVPYEETPAVTGHTKESSEQQKRPLPPPIFSTFTDNYPKQLAILILTSSNNSLDTFSKSIIDTWGKLAKKNKLLSVDLWFSTSEDTLEKFGWPNIPYDDGNDNDNNDNDKEGSENINNNHDDITEGIINKKGLSEKELKELLKEILQETIPFKESIELNNEQREFQKLTKALHYLYENHLDHYNYILKITDKTFVRLPKLLELLSILNNNIENNFITMKQPKLIGKSKNLEEKNFCLKGSSYIINRNLLTIIGPHLPFCLRNIIKNKNIKNNNNNNNNHNNNSNSDNKKKNNDDDSNDLQNKDENILTLERCFINYVPTFKGCETFIGGGGGNGTDDGNNNNNDLKKLRGYEFLYLRPDDETNWEKYKEPLEIFNNEYIDGWRFADAIVIGDVKDPSDMIKLEEWYGKDGKFDKLVKEMGGVIPDPEPIPVPIIKDEEENHNDHNDEEVNNKETDIQNQQTENVNDDNILTIMTAVPTETDDEIISTTVYSLVSSTVLTENLPEEQIGNNSKNILDTIDTIDVKTQTSITTAIPPTEDIKDISNNDNVDDSSSNNVDDSSSNNVNDNDYVEVGDLKNGEELAEP